MDSPVNAIFPACGAVIVPQMFQADKTTFEEICQYTFRVVTIDKLNQPFLPWLLSIISFEKYVPLFVICLL